jgi:hypothetical protein
MKAAPLSRPPLWASLPIVLLLLVGAIKSSQVVAKGYLVMSPVAEIAHTWAWILPWLVVVSLVVAIVLARRVALLPTFAFGLLAALYIYAAAATYAANEPELAARFALALGTVLAVQLYLASTGAAGLHPTDVAGRAVLLFAAVLIPANFADWLLGGGYSPYSLRFYGTADHPNFLGVQLAVCCLALIALRRSSSWWRYLTKIALGGAGLWLLYLTGSRTGIVVLISGVAANFALTERAPKTVLVGLFVLLAAAIAYVNGAFGNLDAIEVYNRGGVNTRYGPWAQLWDQIQQAPWLGLGHFPSSAESSPLRGWATLGIAYPVVLLLVLGFACSHAGRTAKAGELWRVAPLAAIGAGITAGAVFEGYLLDASSLPLYGWLLALAVLGVSARLLEPPPAARVPPHPATIERRRAAAREADAAEPRF